MAYVTPVTPPRPPLLRSYHGDKAACVFGIVIASLTLAWVLVSVLFKVQAKDLGIVNKAVSAVFFIL